MMLRTVVIPARYLLALDAALDELLEKIERGRVPAFQDSHQLGDMMIRMELERPEPAPEPRRSEAGGNKAIRLVEGGQSTRLPTPR